MGLKKKKGKKKVRPVITSLLSSHKLIPRSFFVVDETIPGQRPVLESGLVKGQLHHHGLHGKGHRPEDMTNLSNKLNDGIKQTRSAFTPIADIFTLWNKHS